MRKAGVVFLTALFALSSVSIAEAAKRKKKGKRAKAAVTKVDSNTGSAMLVRDGLSQILVPFQPRKR